MQVHAAAGQGRRGPSHRCSRSGLRRASCGLGSTSRRCRRHQTDSWPVTSPRDEIDVQLLVPADQEVPPRGPPRSVMPWCVRSDSHRSRLAGRFLDSVQFSGVTETDREWSRGTANFFDCLPATRRSDRAPPTRRPLTLEQRHHAAAYAAAAAAVGLDAIVTTAPTVGRPTWPTNDHRRERQRRTMQSPSSGTTCG